MTAPVTPEPAAPTRTALVPISTPQPAFPVEALRSNITGKVVATFTVGTDGNVTNVRIVRSQPRGVFDKSVQSTVGKWRFQPIDASRDVTQTFTFAQ